MENKVTWFLRIPVINYCLHHMTAGKSKTPAIKNDSRLAPKRFAIRLEKKHSHYHNIIITINISFSPILTHCLTQSNTNHNISVLTTAKEIIYQQKFFWLKEDKGYISDILKENFRKVMVNNLKFHKLDRTVKFLFSCY